MSVTEPLTVGVVVTCFNSSYQTARCLEAVLRESNRHVDSVIVVDDGSIPALDFSRNEKVKIIRNETNLGYVASVNRGFAEIKSNIVILLDCDAYVLGNFATQARQMFEEDEQLGLAGFLLEDEQGQPTGSHEAEPTVWSLVLGQKGDGWLRKWVRKGDKQVYFSCAIAVRRQCFNDLGGFDPRFDFLDADIDFSMRVNRSRWHARIGEGLRAIHEGGGSPQTVAQRVVRHHVNRYTLLEKHDLIRIPILVHFAVLVRTAFELAILNSLFFFDSSERRVQQRHSRLGVLRHFLRMRKSRVY